MAYNIGEKPGQGGYVCPNCGCRVGEMTAIARRGELNAPQVRQTTYTVKNVRSHFARLKSVFVSLVFAGLMFASGFAAKTLLPTELPIESSGGSSAKSSSGDVNLNSNTGNAGVGSANANVSAGNPSVTVWVNTNSGVYHCPNTQWYGNTKSGKYMTQKEAQSKGYRPAHGSVCG
jgi:hypothetical protein